MHLLSEKLKALALAAKGAKFHTEGFEQAEGRGQFYGGLIMHEDEVTIVAQCVLQPWADYIAAACPAAVLELIAEVEKLRAELATRGRAEGGGTSENGGLLDDSKTAETRKGTGFEGGHLGSAPAAGTDKDAEDLPLYSTRQDAERFRRAIALEDNAETLYAAVLNHAPDATAIRREFDAAIGAHTTKESTK